MTFLQVGVTGEWGNTYNKVGGIKEIGNWGIHTEMIIIAGEWEYQRSWTSNI